VSTGCGQITYYSVVDLVTAEGGILHALRYYQFDRLYGALWPRIIDDDARRVVTDSSHRYLQWLRGEAITTDAGT